MMLNRKSNTTLKYIFFCFFTIICILLPIIFITSYNKDKRRNTNKTTAITKNNSSFKDFTNDIFCELVVSDAITYNYILSDASIYGIKTAPTTIGDMSKSSFDERINYAQDLINSLLTYDYDSLSAEEQLVYDTLMWNLNQEISSKDYYLYNEILNSTTGIQSQLPILLSEYHFNNETSVNDYLNMLPSIYDYFKSISEFEKEKAKNNLFMSTDSANSIISQCQNFITDPANNLLITIFAEKIYSMPDISEQKKAEYIAKNTEIVNTYVIPAYKLLIGTLNTLKSTSSSDGALCNYAQGKEYYSSLVKTNSGSSRSIDDIIELIEESIVADNNNMYKLISDNSSVIDEYYNSEYGISDSNEIIEHLITSMSEDFPEPKKVNYTVKSVHESLQDYVSPAFFIVPTIDNYTENVVYINNSQKYTNTSLFTNLAHESYPGHLYQNAYFSSVNKYPLLNILANSGYLEGWASYVTILSYKYSDLSPDVALLNGYNNSLVLLLSARADIGIHYESWTKDNIKTFFSDNNCALDDSAVDSLYEIIISDPGNYLTYAVGYLEIRSMKETAQIKLGDNFNLKDFHKFILDCGPIPFEIINKQLAKKINN